MGIAGDIAIILVAALACSLVARKLKVPAMLGYIVAGVIVGQHTLGPTVVHVEDVEVLADIGVALLLFTVGLEFPVEKLAPVKKIALIGTPIQVILTIICGYLVGFALKWPWQSCLWFGCLISVSSTMVVLKILADRGLTGTLSSRVMTAILIIQDLAVIPMMILLPATNNLESGMVTLLIALAKSAVFVAVMFIFGSKLLPYFMAKIAGWRSREIFTTYVLALGLGIGYATYQIGLSFAFGAFLAGMVLSRSDYSHHALSEIIPLRDLFTLLFFVSVGMLIDPEFLVEHGLKLLFLLVVVFVCKAVIFGAVTRMFGYVNIMPLAVGLYMFQVGEFSFVLARLGSTTGAIPDNVYMSTITIAALSMGLTPFVAKMADPIYQWWRKRRNTEPVNNIDIVEKELKDHIVVIGYGRVGRYLANLFKISEKVLVLEEQPTRVERARQDGHSVIGGDASSRTLLEAAQLDKAKLAILSIPNPIPSTITMQRIKQLSPELSVLARASSVEHQKELVKNGAKAALVPEMETGYSLLRETMKLVGYSMEACYRIEEEMRTMSNSPTLAEIYKKEDENGCNENSPHNLHIAAT